MKSVWLEFWDGSGSGVVGGDGGWGMGDGE